MGCGASAAHDQPVGDGPSAGGGRLHGEAAPAGTVLSELPSQIPASPDSPASTPQRPAEPLPRGDSILSLAGDGGDLHSLVFADTLIKPLKDGRRGDCKTVGEWMDRTADDNKLFRDLLDTIHEDVPMYVMSFSELLAYGGMPRSSVDSVAKRPVRGLPGSAYIFFVSHRWRRPHVDADKAHPDDEKGGKFRMLLKSVEKLGEKLGFAMADVYLWIDFFCIDQDDNSRKLKGIAALMGYLAVCDSMLIPSPDNLELTPSDYGGRVTVDRVPGGYGERAWTRLEAMAFFSVSCVKKVEALQQFVAQPPLRRAPLVGPDAVETPGVMAVQYHFDAQKLPSEGVIFSEDDRAVVRELEVSILTKLYDFFVAEAHHIFSHYGRLLFGNILPGLSSDQRQSALRRLFADWAEDICDMGSIGIRDADMKALSDALAHNDYLAELDLRGNVIGDEGAEAMAQALRTNTALTELDLSDNQVEDRGSCALGEALGTNVALATFRLTRNAVADAGAAALAKALQTTSTLVGLDLAENKIGSEGSMALAAALAANQSLSSLRLSENTAGSDGGKAFGESLRRNNSLAVLDLCGNGIGSEAAGHLAAGLAANSTLTELDVSRNGIGTDGIVSFGAALRTNASLTTLVISYNTIGEEVNAEQIGAAAAALLESRSLTKVDLSGHDFGAEGMSFLADALQRNTTLTELDLLDVNMGDVGAHALCAALAHNTTLTKLDVSANSLSNEEALREAWNGEDDMLLL